MAAVVDDFGSGISAFEDIPGLEVPATVGSLDKIVGILQVLSPSRERARASRNFSFFETSGGEPISPFCLGSG